MKNYENCVSHLRMKNGQTYVLLDIFSETSLRPKCHLKVDDLYNAFKFLTPDILRNSCPSIYRFINENGQSKFRYEEEQSNISYHDLLKECIEVQLFCKKFFPELMI